MVDPNNIGWVGPVYIHKKGKVLLVRNLLQETQIKKELKNQNLPPTEENIAYIVEGFKKAGTLEKPGNWELAGAGRIPWWTNEILLKEFQKLDPTKAPNKFTKKTKIKEFTPEQKEFLKNIGQRILADEKLLLSVASAAADEEILEEAGLFAQRKRLFWRQKDMNKNDRTVIYPRFWYIVDSATGELRKEASKGEISPPKWISLENLYPTKPNLEPDHFPIHWTHMRGIKKALNQLIEEGNTELKFSLELLETRFQETKKSANPTDTVSPDDFEWERMIKNVIPLK